MFSILLFFPVEGPAQCDVYYLETKMIGYQASQGMLRHKGLRFSDGKKIREFHLDNGGYKICDINGHQCDGYLIQKKVKKINKSVDESIDWCKRWAITNPYSLTAYDCWNLVESFFKAHGIECMKSRNELDSRNISVVPGALRGVHSAKKAAKNGDHLEAMAHLVSAPLRGTCESIDSAVNLGGRALKDSKEKFIKFLDF